MLALTLPFIALVVAGYALLSAAIIGNLRQTRTLGRSDSAAIWQLTSGPAGMSKS
jgi:hypothetical protein